MPRITDARSHLSVRVRALIFPYGSVCTFRRSLTLTGTTGVIIADAAKNPKNIGL
jgi:hypothetical protein